MDPRSSSLQNAIPISLLFIASITLLSRDWTRISALRIRWVWVSKVCCLYQPVWPSSWSCWLGICPGYEGQNSPGGGNRLVWFEGCWGPCLQCWCLLWNHKTDCPAGPVHCLPSDPQETSDTHTIHSEHTQEAILRFYEYLQNSLLYYPLKPGGYFVYQQGWHWEILHSSHRMHLCVLKGSQNKQRLYSCTVLTS
jgi:hypothetical protein